MVGGRNTLAFPLPEGHGGKTHKKRSYLVYLKPYVFGIEPETADKKIILPFQRAVVPFNPDFAGHPHIKHIRQLFPSSLFSSF
jgi:hypothetical protein